jgi:hypothetical protein
MVIERMGNTDAPLLDKPALPARACYRVGQFVRGWRAAVTPTDWALVNETLTPAAIALFARMPADAQAHSLRVLKELQAGGDTSPDLAVAALLHDVGKVAANDAGAYLGLWLRGPLVLLEAWRPDWLRAWATPVAGPTLRYALYVHLEHPAIGAQWAAEAGCSPAACWLIAHHQNYGALRERQLQHDLARLQWADGRN